MSGGRRRAVAVALAPATALAVAAAILTGCGLGGSGSDDLATDRVPAELVPIFRDAAARYPALTPAQLAAQARIESKFDPLAVSRVGARGLMQFMPQTWRRFGVDGNRDGRTDPLDPADAIPTAASYDAHLMALLKPVPGQDRVAVVLAAYNAGPGAVTAAHGIPRIAETRAYIRRVRTWSTVFQAQFDAAVPDEARLGRQRRAGPEHPPARQAKIDRTGG